MYPDEFVFKTIEDYRSNLRSNARAFWTGEWDWFSFYQEMMSSVKRGFTQAWAEGMAKYNLKLSDQNQEERTRLAQEIFSESLHIERVADFIDSNSKVRGGKLSSCMQRIEQWVTAYTRIKQLATSLAAKDKPLKWTIDAPKESCSSCKKLNGKVKRGSYWKSHVTPKNWEKLECRNGCKCTLEPTTDPLSKGPLPRLP